MGVIRRVSPILRDDLFRAFARLDVFPLVPSFLVIFCDFHDSFFLRFVLELQLLFVKRIESARRLSVLLAPGTSILGFIGCISILNF